MINFLKSRNKKRYSFPRIEFHITDHCNLDCRGCAHFSNISPEHFLSLETFEKDFREITKKIDYKLINILGGEPLLHPDISYFFDIARKIKQNITITLNTNGILLPRMNNEFWASLKRNNVRIRLSAYPATKENFNEYIKIINEHDIHGEVWNGLKFYLRKKKIANEDKNKLFKDCDARICHQLYKGTLYPCPTAAYGHFYNKYFNKNFYTCSGINIYENSAKEIYEFITSANENCKTCTKEGKLIPWQKSKYLEEEWDAE